MFLLDGGYGVRLRLPPYLHELYVYAVRMEKDRNAEPRSLSGPWTIYRRKEDAGMWMRFEVECINDGLKPSQKLAELAREFVIKRSGI